MTDLTITFPALNPGEKFVGIILSADGKYRHALILLPGEAEPDEWQAQMDWAASVGGELPDRVEAALLFATMGDEFKDGWYWTREQYAEDADYAWVQDFGDGNPNYWDKSYDHRVACRPQGGAMTDINKLCDELEALLKEATPGPWKARNALVYLGGHGGFSLQNCPAPEENAALISALHNTAQSLIDAARIGARYTRMSESGETLGDALDLREENTALRAAHRGCAELYERSITENERLRERIKDLQEVLEDKRRLARELDIALSGPENAARRASLCDLIPVARKLRAKIDYYENALCFPSVPARWLDEGVSANEIRPSRVADVLAERDNLRERIKELEINERAWLIEKQISNTTVWLCGLDNIGVEIYPRWTPVATEAIRFCRERDAKIIMNHYPVFGEVIATEHIF